MDQIMVHVIAPEIQFRGFEDDQRPQDQISKSAVQTLRVAMLVRFLSITTLFRSRPFS